MNGLNIIERHNTLNFIAGLSNFSLVEGEAISPDSVVNNSNISFYCLDEQRQAAIFVELPPDVDLSQVPFVFHTQTELAQQFISVPYEQFKQLAGQLPPLDHLILTFMTGRCGSTVLSSALNQSGMVNSLAEIGVISQFVHMRTLGIYSDAELSSLLDLVLRFVFKPTTFNNASIFDLKLRTESMLVMDLLIKTFPQAHNIFLYRDVVGWVASYYHLFTRDYETTTPPLQTSFTVVRDFVRAVPAPYMFLFQDFQQLVQLLAPFEPRTAQEFGRVAKYLDFNANGVSLVQVLTLWWISIMESYLDHLTPGMAILPVDYHDLNTDRQTTLTQIFEYCNIPQSEVNQALGAFEHDAQHGTVMARDKANEGNPLRLSTDQINQITTIMARHPSLNETNFDKAIVH